MLGGEIECMFEHKSNHHDAPHRGFELTAPQSVDEIAMEDARALLTEHVTWAQDEFRALGAPRFDPMRHVDKFFAGLDAVLPPKGAYLLAHGRDRRAIGTGALRRVSAETGEMKHLFVRPEMRGTGLGEALIVARIKAARALGLRTIVADTFRGNTPMIRLYRRLGFADAAPYESAVATITPELVPHLQYFRMDL